MSKLQLYSRVARALLASGKTKNDEERSRFRTYFSIVSILNVVFVSRIFSPEYESAPFPPLATSLDPINKRIIETTLTYWHYLSSSPIVTHHGIKFNT